MTNQIIIKLVRKSLADKHITNLSLFQNVYWEKVKDSATIRGVLGICLDGFDKQSNSSIFLLFKTKIEWIGQASFMETCFEQHRDVLEELARFYSDHGLNMMVLKGYGLSQYWPKPNHRQVGDLDIFLHYSSQNSELDLPACKHGDLLTIQKLGVKVDEGHEHHKCFLYKSISVENHYDFINIKAHKDAAKIESRLKSLSLNCFQMGSTNQAFLTSSATFNAIFLIRHMGQYFAGECVTLRQVLDWGLFLKHEGDKVTWSEVIPFLKKKGIWRFFQQINSICVDYLGIEMPKEVPALEREEQFERRILKDILQPEFEEQKTKELILY